MTCISLIMLHNPPWGLHLCLHSFALLLHCISVGGLAAGVAYSVPSKRGIVPVMAAGVAGSLADVMWGLMVECQSEVSAYKESRGMK